MDQPLSEARVNSISGRLVKLAGSNLVRVTLGTVPIYMDVALVALALPAFQVAFGATPEMLAHLLKIQLLCLLAGLLPSGYAVDRYGALCVFRAGTFITTLGTALGCLSASWECVLLARGVQGVGYAALLSAAAPWLHRTAPEKQRNWVLARWSTCGALVYAVSPLLGGALSAGLGWRLLFVLPLLPSLLATVLVLHPVIPSAALAVHSQEWSVRHLIVRGHHWIGLLVNFGFIPTFFLIGLLAVPPSSGGQWSTALLLSLTLALPAGSLLAEALMRRMPVRLMLLTSLLLASLGQLVLGVAWDVVPTIAWLVLPLTLVGLACAVAVPALMSVLLESEAQSNLGAAMSLFALSRQAGSLAGMAAIGYLLNAELGVSQAWIARGLALPYVLAAAICLTQWRGHVCIKRF